MGLKELGIIFALMLISFSISPVRAESATVSDIAKELMCMCPSCYPMVLADCDKAECAWRDAVITLIEQKLAQGQSKEQIIQFFVAQYGEAVLASPPKRGFNLTARLSPFAALLVGGGVVYFALKTWVRRGKRFQATTIIETKEEDEEYRRRLERELKEFTDRCFR